MKFIHHKLVMKQHGLLLLLFIINVPALAMDMDGMSDTPRSMHALHAKNSHSSEQSKNKSHHVEEVPPIVQHSSSSATASGMTSMDHRSMQENSDMGHSDINHKVNGINDNVPIQQMNHDNMNDISMTKHMRSMQGGTAPANARSSDYSQGRNFGPIHPPMMMGNDPLMSISVKRLEVLHSRDRHQGAYDIEGWWGDDWNRAVLKAEGEIDRQRLSDARTEFLWRRPLDTFWNTELGVRQDSGHPNNRTWLSLGIEGISPYWVKLDATVYMRDRGQVAMILTGEYDWRITQRLILQPRIEISLYGKSDRTNDIGRGLSEVQSGLRMRYAISRQFAPYMGFESNRNYGQTADLMKASSQNPNESRAVAGIMFWF
jgi:copper resistance protein B